MLRLVDELITAIIWVAFGLIFAIFIFFAGSFLVALFIAVCFFVGAIALFDRLVP